MGKDNLMPWSLSDKNNRRGIETEFGRVLELQRQELERKANQEINFRLKRSEPVVYNSEPETYEYKFLGSKLFWFLIAVITYLIIF
jgi:hypothetical protein